MADDGALNGSSGRQIWFYGANEGLACNVSDTAAGFKGVGKFRQDFKALCQRCGVVSHPALLPPREDDIIIPDKGDGDTLSLQSALLDRKALEVASHIIPQSFHLKAIRLNGCRLDPEMCGLLRAGLTDTCTVQTLHLDWNPMEVPLDVERARAIVAAGQPDTIAELDELERSRDKRQTERVLVSFRELLVHRAHQEERAKLAAEAALKVPEEPPPSADAKDKKKVANAQNKKDGGSRPWSQQSQKPEMTTDDMERCLATAVQQVAAAAAPRHVGTAKLEPLDVSAWTFAFKRRWGLPSHVTESVFAILDGGARGIGDGYVPILRLERAFADLPPLVAPEATPDPQDKRKGSKPAKGKPAQDKGDAAPNPEADDAVGHAFAGFVNAASPLEIVSFRCCSIGRIEMNIVGKALQVCKHLRALNLWGNHLCDTACIPLAEALEANFTIQCLALGRNVITHEGLAVICRAVGAARIDDKKEADGVGKHIKDQMKERDKLLKKPEPPKVDSNGRERYKPPFQVDTLEDKQDDSTGLPYWLHWRNVTLRILNVEENLVSDSKVVLSLQPFGVGDMILRGNGCVAQILEERAAAAAAAEAAANAGDGAAEVAATGADTCVPSPADNGDGGRSLGWNLVLG